MGLRASLRILLVLSAMGAWTPAAYAAPGDDDVRELCAERRQLQPGTPQYQACEAEARRRGTDEAAVSADQDRQIEDRCVRRGQLSHGTPAYGACRAAALEGFNNDAVAAAQRPYKAMPEEPDGPAFAPGAERGHQDLECATFERKGLECPPDVRDRAGAARGRGQVAAPTTGAGTSAHGEARVAMVRDDGGVWRVPVRINGAIELRFMVDSGASTVVIPVDVFLTLARAGTLTDADYLGDETYVLADGSTGQTKRYRIHRLQVGTVVLTDVAASVGDARGELLLGQSFLGRFRSWSIDNGAGALVLKP